MRAREFISEKWSEKYKRSIDCSRPRGFSQRAHCAGRKKADESYNNDLNQPRGPEFKPTMPRGTVRVDVSDVYDWYKLGSHISNLKGLGRHDFGKGPPSTIISFGDEDTEHEYIKDLEQTGLTTTDIDPIDPDQPSSIPRQKTDPTYAVDENFADGRKPGRRGLARRVGVNCKQPASKLRKIAKNSSGERQRMPFVGVLI